MTEPQQSFGHGYYIVGDESFHEDSEKGRAYRRERGLALNPFQWRPIKTAPRDEILLVSDGAIVTAARNNPHGVLFAVAANNETYMEGGKLRRLNFTPTHWMPLPAPPQ